MLKVDKLYDEIHKSWKYDDLLWRHKEIYADIQSFGYSMSRLYHSVRNVCRGSIVYSSKQDGGETKSSFICLFFHDIFKHVSIAAWSEAKSHVSHTSIIFSCFRALAAYFFLSVHAIHEHV